MKKLLSTVTVIAILGILAAIGFFGYTKYQAVELEKDKLQAQQKELNQSDSQSSSETVNNNQANNNQNSNQEQAQSTTEADKNDEQQVTRDNVFDYLFKYLESEGADTSLIKFQEPVEDGNGNFKIAANNKSGAGSYNYEITSEGVVKDINNAGEVEDSVQINLN